MDATTGQTAAPLIEEISTNCKTYAFFQAVYLLQKAQRDSVPVGFQGPVSREALRFRANLSLGFPSADIQSIEKAEQQAEGKLPELLCTVNFLGLYGPASPLPAFYTEELMPYVEDENTARHFLDLYHHRLVSLLYRSWEKYRYYLHYRPGATDQFSKQIFALFGLGFVKPDDGSAIQLEKLIPITGLLALRARSAKSISGALSVYFEGLPVSIDEYIEQEVEIDSSQWTSLGIDNCSLGQSAFVGKRVKDISSKFRIRLGPVSFENYCRFLPGQNWHKALRELVNLLVVDRFDYDLKLKVDVTDVPVTRLLQSERQGLGWTTWLGKPRERYITIHQEAF